MSVEIGFSGWNCQSPFNDVAQYNHSEPAPGTGSALVVASHHCPSCSHTVVSTNLPSNSCAACTHWSGKRSQRYRSTELESYDSGIIKISDPARNTWGYE